MPELTGAESITIHLAAAYLFYRPARLATAPKLESWMTTIGTLTGVTLVVYAGMLIPQGIAAVATGACVAVTAWTLGRLTFRITLSWKSRSWTLTHGDHDPDAETRSYSLSVGGRNRQ